MQYRKAIYFILAALLALSLILAGIIWIEKSQELKIIFLDVGQGDAILISQGSQQILIDGGKSGKILLEKLGKYIPFWDRKIEAVIVTHPDADHIGGLPDAFRAYRIESVIRTRDGSDSEIFKALADALQKEAMREVEAVRGASLKLTGGAILEIVYPLESFDGSEGDSNAGSVVAALRWREDSFLLAGDLPMDKEAVLIAEDGRNVFGVLLPSRLKSRVLKIGHHGSKYSTSEEFLDTVQPEEAVISVGKNSYGHPAPEVLERLRKRNAKTRRTDEAGDIVYKCSDSENRCRVF